MKIIETVEDLANKTIISSRVFEGDPSFVVLRTSDGGVFIVRVETVSGRMNTEILSFVTVEYQLSEFYLRDYYLLDVLYLSGALSEREYKNVKNMKEDMLSHNPDYINDSSGKSKYPPYLKLLGMIEQDN